MTTESSSLSSPSSHRNTASSTLNKSYQNEILNPYFMHPNENPALVLVSPILNTDNYHFWSRSLTMALQSKNKLHFINGALPQPPDEDRDSIAWDRCNTIKMSWLNNSVESEISLSVLWMKHLLAYGRNSKVKNRFYHRNIFRISEIQEEICTIRQGGSFISSHYTKLKMLCLKAEETIIFEVEAQEVVDSLLIVEEHQGQINNVSTEHEQEDEAHHESSDEQLNDTASGIIGFTPAQHKALLALL
ncbi:uncharacterized protein LOC131658149 [Vicia villosa]|uniref:uncharacterized protein LOC131658149 n=1 Tax=Vicia villosa TaxID=3911 RepID=UPI00273C1793|nr:uncharacterized protein LOC131658149 [Vicia villosa]